MVGHPVPRYHGGASLLPCRALPCPAPPCPARSLLHFSALPGPGQPRAARASLGQPRILSGLEMRFSRPMKYCSVRAKVPCPLPSRGPGSGSGVRGRPTRDTYSHVNGSGLRIHAKDASRRKGRRQRGGGGGGGGGGVWRERTGCGPARPGPLGMRLETHQLLVCADESCCFFPRPSPPRLAPCASAIVIDELFPPHREESRCARGSRLAARRSISISIALA